MKLRLILQATGALLALLLAACSVASPRSVPSSTPSDAVESARTATTAVAPKAVEPKPAESARAAAPAATGSQASSDRAKQTDAPAASLTAPAAPAAAAPQRAGSAAAPAPTPAAPPVAKPAGQTSASQTAPLPPVTAPNRMIIFSTSLTLLVRSVEDALRVVTDLASLHGGYVASVENGSENGLPFSIVRIKVLPDRYIAVMNELRHGSLAVEVRDEKATTQDVTEEYSDVQTQLASLEATHRQLLDLMSRATTMEEILKIQQQAAQVKLQIDRLKGRATVLERLSEFATITARLQSAEAVLGRDYVAVRTQLRQAQSQLAQLQLALQRAKTPEEEARIRDQLGELQLQLERLSARMAEIEQKASLANVTLPKPLADDVAPTQPQAELPEQFIAARIKLRQAEARQSEIIRRLKLSLPPDEQTALRRELGQLLLTINETNAELRRIQERAQQLGVSLPNLTPEQEAALAGTTVEVTQPDPLRAIATAWDASLTFLRGALAAVLGAVVFVWWALPMLALLAALAVWSGRLRPRPRPATAAADSGSPSA